MPTKSPARKISAVSDHAGRAETSPRGREHLEGRARLGHRPRRMTKTGGDRGAISSARGLVDVLSRVVIWRVIPRGPPGLQCARHGAPVFVAWHSRRRVLENERAWLRPSAPGVESAISTPELIGAARPARLRGPPPGGALFGGLPSRSVPWWGQSASFRPGPGAPAQGGHGAGLTCDRGARRVQNLPYRARPDPLPSPSRLQPRRYRPAHGTADRHCMFHLRTPAE